MQTIAIVCNRMAYFCRNWEMGWEMGRRYGTTVIQKAVPHSWATKKQKMERRNGEFSAISLASCNFSDWEFRLIS